jgi:outer membrane receptor for monomeric catechols
MAVYVQDTWKVTRKLTLDYGIRWDYQQAPEEAHTVASMFGPTIPNPTPGVCSADDF